MHLDTHLQPTNAHAHSQIRALSVPTLRETAFHVLNGNAPPNRVSLLKHAP